MTQDPREWERVLFPWSMYPVGTVARSHIGSTWTKLDGGAWKANKGDTFPRPGADAFEVNVPASPSVSEDAPA